ERSAGAGRLVVLGQSGMRAVGGLRSWIAGAVFAAACLAFATAAQAQCTPTLAGGEANVTATCSGTVNGQNGPNGYGTGDQTNLGVTVNGGATVTGSNSGIHAGNGLNLTNSGAIEGTSGSGYGVLG